MDNVRVLDSVIEAIGNTPLVRLDRLTKAHGVEGTLLAKLDYLSPGFSKKDRAAREVIEEARRDGRLSPGQPVVELTSGNMGTGLAIVCAILGHPFIAVMSRGNSQERARMMAALGAEVVLVEQAAGSVPGQVSGEDLALVDRVADELVRQRGAFRADQFRNASNWRAHYRSTGPEIWSATGGRIDAFVDFVGSGGTYAGVTKALKERDPKIQCFIVEPEGAAVLGGEAVRNPGHPIQGGGYATADLRFLHDVPVDGYLQVAIDEARATARSLAVTEGIFAGFSSGANVAAALQLLGGAMAGRTICVIICDSGLKYLSTDLWSNGDG